MPRQTSRSVRFLTGAVLLFLAGSAVAQEYYGVPIEDGGVAFLLDASGSMENRGEKIKAAAESILRGLASVVKGTPAAPPPLAKKTKMAAARRELMHALSTLREGTRFTIITFGESAAEWPGGVRAAGPAATALAREYVAGLSAWGGTPMAEALQLGFRSSEVRTLFVVSDGRPTTGDVLALVRQLQESREGRRMVINTVGIGTDQDGALLCQLALDNEGVYVRDGAVACTFSPCSSGDGIVTFYPPAAARNDRQVTEICSSAEHPGCTPELVYQTMLSQARFQTLTRDRTQITNCLKLERPDPITIVVDEDGLEATNYTRPGHPLHPGKTMRIVRQQGDGVVVETSSAGKLRSRDLEAADRALIDAVRGKLEPGKPEREEFWKKAVVGKKDQR